MKPAFTFLRVPIVLLCVLASMVIPIVFVYFGFADVTIARHRYSTVIQDNVGQPSMFSCGTRTTVLSSQHQALFGVMPLNHDPATMFLDAPDACPQPYLCSIAKIEVPRLRQRASKLSGRVDGIDAGFPFRSVGSLRFERQRDDGFDPAEYRPPSSFWRRWYSSSQLLRIGNYAELRDHLYWWSPLATILNIAAWTIFAFIVLSAKKWFCSLREHRRVRRGLCHKCCYNLASLPVVEKCPECGSPTRDKFARSTIG
jgi:hypothetical protein